MTNDEICWSGERLFGCLSSFVLRPSSCAERTMFELSFGKMMIIAVVALIVPA